MEQPNPVDNLSPTKAIPSRATIVKEYAYDVLVAISRYGMKGSKWTSFVKTKLLDEYEIQIIGSCILVFIFLLQLVENILSPVA